MTIKQQGGIFGRNPTFNNVTVDGSLNGLSNLSISGDLIVADGQGIDFSATSGTGTSELLDDYEEGTWTPTDSSGAGLSFSEATGVYTKVGRMVFATGQVRYPVTSDTSNSKIGGLPFSTISGNARGVGSVNYKQTANVATLNIDPSATTFGFFTETGSGTDNNQISNKVVYFGMVYTTS